MPHSASMRVSMSETDDKLRSIEALRELVRREPSNIGFRVRLGWWLVEVNELQEAGEHFKTALELDPNRLDAAWGLAIVLHGQDKDEDAVEILRGYLRRRPDDLKARRYLADIYGYSEDTLDRAVMEYQEILKQNPGDIETVKKLAKVLIRLGRYEDAIGYYDRLITAHPDDRELRLEKARALSWAKRYEESVALYQRILEQDPGDVDARLALAEVLNWSGRRGEAIREFEGVLAVDPKNLRARLGLARALSWSGKANGAIRVFEEIKKDDPKNVDAHLGLADVYSRIGDPGRAEAEYRQVLMLDPANEEAKEGLKIALNALSAQGDLWYAIFFDANDFVRQGVFAAFTWYPTPKTLIEIGNAFSGFEQDGRDIQRETPSIKMTSRPSPDVDLTLGYRFNYYLGEGTTNNFLAGISYRAFDATTLGFTFDRIDIVDSKGIFEARGYNPIIDIEAVFQRIRSSDFTASVHHDFTDRVVLDGSYTFGDQSDGNEKNEAFAQLSYRTLSRPDRYLDLRGNVYYLAYDDESPLYFSPDELVNVAGVISWHHEISDRLSYDLENALQYEYMSGDSGAANQFLGRVRYKITEDTEISLSGFSFVESIDEYWSLSFLIGLSHRF